VFETSEHDDYYDAEWSVAADSTHPHHILPPLDPGAIVLDIGCGGGFPQQNDVIAWRVSVDVNHGALRYQQRRFGRVDGVVGRGEQLPIRAQAFTHCCARVSLPYMPVDAFLREAYSVLRGGGKLWLTCHGPMVPIRHLWRSVKGGQWKDVIYRSYVLLNGTLFHVVGRQFRFPVNKRFDSFHTRRALRRALLRAGFTDVQFPEAGQHFLVTAVKPATVT
jgi:SAM-dependent methyltransferase